MEKLILNQFEKFLQPRPRDAHKGNCGHVLVIGGDIGLSGAVRMAGESALRVGAGLVSVATRIEHAEFITIARPELMCHGIGFANELSDLLEKTSVILIGPGLGKMSWGQELLNFVIEMDKPMVVDADALNIIAEQKKTVNKNNWILTPHPGEASRLLNSFVSDVQHDRLNAVKKLQEKFGGVCVLKGAGTLIATANSISICEAGNPGMATAGMGDILGGVMAGLLAQQVPLENAAKLGVLIHAMAGDLAAKEGERGMIATDLLQYLRRFVNP
jgi:hydroxyethylthiazole kinase-like uncharacterized protein yjeF